MEPAAPAIVVRYEDFMYFVERAVHGMVDVLTGLGDDRACARPELPGANSPYGLLTHCLGVMDYWGGHLVAGREVHRDRSAEFTTVGTVAELRDRARESLLKLREDLMAVTPAGALHNEPEPWALGPDRPLGQSGALIHLYEELAQHHGQLQILAALIDERLGGPLSAADDDEKAQRA